MTKPHLRPMSIDDYDQVYALWQATEGVGLDPSDERDPLAKYLDRNPGLSTVAVAGDRVVGAVLCGYDGRRGDLVHLAVAEGYRGQGIGREMVAACLGQLATLGMIKCNLRVFDDNLAAAKFWDRLGFAPRKDLIVWQRSTDC